MAFETFKDLPGPRPGLTGSIVRWARPFYEPQWYWAVYTPEKTVWEGMAWTRRGAKRALFRAPWTAPRRLRRSGKEFAVSARPASPEERP